MQLLVRSTLVLALAGLPPVHRGAQGIRVSGALPPGIAGDVTAFRISPDSQRVVYAADQDEDGVVGLFSAPIAGGTAVRLDPRIDLIGSDPEFGQDFEITADSRTVVYRSMADDSLGSVPILGDARPTRLHVPGSAIIAFELSPDSERVVYLARDGGTGTVELFSTTVGGERRTKLSGPMVAGGNAIAFRLTRDGRRVVYRADQATDDVHELWSAPLEGGSPAVRINASLATGEDVTEFELADSKRVVYRAESSFEQSRLVVAAVAGGASLELASGFVETYQVTPDARRVAFVRDGQLFVTRITGGTAVPLSAPLQDREHVDEFRISPDSKRVVYHVQRGRYEGEEQVALYSVSIQGGPATLLARPPDLYVGSPSISPDGRDVVFALYDYGTTIELWSRSIEGGPATRIDTHEVELVGFRPDSSRVVYVLRPGYTFPPPELFSAPLAGGAPTRLNGDLVEMGRVLAGFGIDGARPAISPDGTRVVYVADQERDDVLELFSVAIDGGPAVRLNSDLASGGIGGDVQDSIASPDGTHVLYRADQDADDVEELYSVRVAGAGVVPGSPVKLNGALVRNGDVGAFRFLVTPDSKRALYVADQEVVGIGELYSVPIEGGTALKCNEARGVGIGIHGFLASPDSRHVVFQNDRDEAGRPELFSAPIAGGPNVELSADVAEIDFVSGTEISSDSRRVVFRALHHDETAVDLYSIPIEGGTLTRLDPVAVPGGRVGAFRVLPDASGVVYTGDIERDEMTELFLVPLDGGPSTKLSGTLINLGDVVAFQVSADSSHVVYRADAERDDRFYLYSVRLSDGALVRLTPELATRRDVRSYAVAPDSSRVVYLADQEADEVFELFSVPIEGGDVTRLNAPLVASGDVDTSPESWAVSPDSRRVVYRADQEQHGRLELYSVPLEGGEVAKLNGPLVFGGKVLDFAITSDSHRVVYRADQLENEVFELFAAPLRGGASVRLNAPLVEFGNVLPALDAQRSFTLAGKRVLYRADQNAYRVFELFLSVLTDGPPPVAPRRL